MHIFSIFFNMTICCMFSLESPRRGDSNEYTQHTHSVYSIFKILRKNSRIRNIQMFTNTRSSSRVSYFLYFFCFLYMFCGKKVVGVFL